MPATTWPRAPYPSDVATHPLLVVDYLKMQSTDAATREAETRILEKACTELVSLQLIRRAQRLIVRDSGVLLSQKSWNRAGEDVCCWRRDLCAPYRRSVATSTLSQKLCSTACTKGKMRTDWHCSRIIAETVLLPRASQIRAG